MGSSRRTIVLSSERRSAGTTKQTTNKGIIILVKEQAIDIIPLVLWPLTNPFVLEFCLISKGSVEVHT